MRVGVLASSYDASDMVLNKYAELFTGISCIKQKYHITLKDNALPVISPIRKVPLPLKDDLQKTLNELEHDGIIAKVDGPSDWGNPLVLVRKPDKFTKRQNF